MPSSDSPTSESSSSSSSGNEDAAPPQAPSPQTGSSAPPPEKSASSPSTETPFSLRVRDQGNESALINQFYSTLESTLTRLEDRGGPRISAHPKTVAHIRELLQHTPPTWRGAYQIEVLLAPLLTDTELHSEIRRRMVDAEELLDADTYKELAAQWQTMQSDPDGDATREEMETLYARLLNDLQWRYEVRQQAREEQRGATRKTGWAFILSAGAFVLIVLAGLEAFIRIDCNASIPLFYNPVLAYQVFIAMTAGFLGAMFSVLTGLRKQVMNRSLNQLRMLNSLGYIITRGVIGLGGALILSYFFASGILEGSIFPDVTQLLSTGSGVNGQSPSQPAPGIDSLATGPAVPADTTASSSDLCEDTIHAAELAVSSSTLQSIAMLVVWSFVAGFSEKLVPNLISNTADRIEKKGRQAK